MNALSVPDIPASDEDRWRIVLDKDRRFDGAFVFGVHSTGIYCRPSCPARAPLRDNVRFYLSPEEAEQAGLRACLRCRPGDVSREEEAVMRALALLKGAQDTMTLDQIARHVAYSPTHFQKVFRRIVGLSPAAYQRALRIERASAALDSGSGVTDAVYAAGYGSPSRFYEASAERFGMTPSAWKNGGRGATICWAVVESSLGPMLVAATDKGVCRLSFNEGREALAARFPEADLIEGGDAFAGLLADVVAQVERPGEGRDIPLDVQGTAFQEAVWHQLRQIPPGETRSYAQIAAAIGKPRAMRAAGSANGANNVAVLIPCHRVVRADGSLGGYAYGEDIKRELLKRERSNGKTV